MSNQYDPTKVGQQAVILGGVHTIAGLNKLYLDVPAGSTAYTSDGGPMVNSGGAWVSAGTGTAVTFANKVTTAALSTRQDNFNPAGSVLGVTNFFDLTLTANVTFTGWAAPPVDGFTIAGWNGTAFTATFTDHDANSVAANQFYTPGATPGSNPANTAGPGSGFLMRYNASLGKWTFLS